MSNLPEELQRAKSFHGHLGPYVVLGLRIGKALLRELNARPHFGLEVAVTGPSKPPPRCVLDGLQLSTGCTYGKGNLTLEKGDHVVVAGTNRDTGQSITFDTNAEKLAQAGRVLREQSDEAAARIVWEASEAELFHALPSASSP